MLYIRHSNIWISQEEALPLPPEEEGETMEKEKLFAILIDADNVAAKYVKTILDEISTEGVATYKRIYGDFTSTNHAKWKDVLLQYSILPVQQYSYTVGKNATDSALIIDAMDILYTGQVDGFCIVSSDSDFTRLAARLREAGKIVIGMGEQKTPRPFVNACSRFKYIDTLFKGEEEKEKPKPPKGKVAAKPKAPEGPEEKPTQSKDTSVSTSLTPLSDIIRDIIAVYHQEQEDDGWMQASLVGDMLTKRYPEFDPRNYGCQNKRTVSFLESLHHFDIKREGKVVFIRPKEESAPQSKRKGKRKA